MNEPKPESPAAATPGPAEVSMPAHALPEPPALAQQPAADPLQPQAAQPAQAELAAAPGQPSLSSVRRWLPWLSLLLCLVGLAWAYSLQERLKASEQELSRRQNESLQQLAEARTVAKQAEAVSRDMAGKLSVLDARVAESTLQRSQLEDLMQSLSRSRDENVLSDIEAALRVAQQQSALTGSTDPLLSALKQTEDRLARVQQPRLERVRRAVLADMDRVRAAGEVDLTALTLRLDEVARQVDELPLLAAQGLPGLTAQSSTPLAADTKGKSNKAAAAKVPPPAGAASAGLAVADDWMAGAQRLGQYVWAEVRQLIRVTRIEQPEAALLAPDQAIYLRENLRIRLLSARLSLLSRQFDVAQSDMKQAQALLDRYFDRSSRRVAAASELLRQTTAQSRSIEVPRPTATLTAIAAATAGR